jgi:superfamily II DNA or RNA helicase
MVVSREWQREQSVAEEQEQRPTLTRFHQRLLAESLTAQGNGTGRVAPALVESRVDLNPHQIEAAVFALEALPRGGAILADEVGLGKTIEAGIVIAQLAAEGRKRCLILAPASLRAQWKDELSSKFGVDAELVDGSRVRGAYHNPFDTGGICIASIPFGSNRARDLARIPWDLVVIDEAHRLRNAYRPNHKTGRALRQALEGRPKLLLTATPLQNELLELFGLLSFLDEKVLGPEQAFRSRFVAGEEGLDDESARELKDRLKSSVVRTLRRQVREYVQFTQRRSVVEDFAPTPEEHDLYEKVSEYLRRSEAVAIEPGKKTLLTLVYRKLLASSSFAIAPTLEKLADGLEARLKRAELTAQGTAFLAQADPDAFAGLAEEQEELCDETTTHKPPGLDQLRSEAFELRQYAEQARRITVNAKGLALTRALQRIFEAARRQKWPEKAVVFTESKRTQNYLFDLLSANGFEGQISVLCGDGSGPDERRALVDEFRNRTQIFLMTDAGAEGLNLQFCNLLVNYDLPWNPQRVEQRIGRCHRYGQTRDVVVVNFVNRSNAADARLYELLEQKLALFDGVFGASDEILGALESGVDFEKRILEIYQSCRTEAEITQAFGELRSELDRHIGARMKKARTLLLERFDGDVRGRLRIASQEAKQAVQRRGRDAEALTASVLGGARRDRKSVNEAASAVKAQLSEAISYLQLDASGLPPHLARLSGREGWWFVYRFSLGGLKPEERLVHLVLVREGDSFRALSLADGAHLARLPAQEEPVRRAPAIAVSSAQEAALGALREELLAEVNERTHRELDRERERAYRFAEDCLVSSRQEVEKARQTWVAARQALDHCDDETLRSRQRSALERADRDYRRKLQGLRVEEEQRYGDREKQLAELLKRAQLEERRTLVATAYCFWD